MSDTLPSELARLLAARPGPAHDEAWSAFTETYSRLLLHTAQRTAADRDKAMDRYAFILEQLRRDDCRKLRSYAPDGRTRFTTWLVVVAQRLCLDHQRHRYGRPSGSAWANPDQDESHRFRSRLLDLVGAPVELDTLPDTESSDPETRLRETELSGALQSAVAALEPRDRLLLKLRFEDELSASEIARVIGLPTPFHVYRRLNQLLPLLKERLARSGVVEAGP